MDLKSFASAIQQIADEKGISREKIFETIEMALAAAYKRDYGRRGQIVRAKMDPDTGKVEVKQIKIVVDESMIKSEEEVAQEEALRAAREGESPAGGEARFVERRPDLKSGREGEAEEAEGDRKVRFSPEKHLMLEEALKIKPGVQPGDELEFPLEYH